MFFNIDFETLGNQDCVALSVAVLWFNGTERDYDELLSRAMFIKFDATEQVKHYHRKIDRDTVAWWKKQSKEARDKSYVPSKNDRPLIVGMTMLHEYVLKHGERNNRYWARGALEPVLYESLCGSLNTTPRFKYHDWRDVRTAIDVMYSPPTPNGYTKVNLPGFNVDRDVIKHDPIHDIAYDVMMLNNGGEQQTIAFDDDIPF